MPVNRCSNPSCEYFNRVLPSNAKICPMCGTTLGNVLSAVSPPPTSPSPLPPPPTPRPIVEAQKYSPIPDTTEYQSRVPAIPLAVPISAPTPKVPLLKLIHSSRREFNLLGESGYIGRRSASKPVPPEIDLTGIPHEGVISRQHARVAWDWTQNAYTLVDMSTNGIYLNGNLITPGVSYRLIHGDSLQMGQENLVNFQVSIC
jgi:pSer/pThr/pTyr-binding forkhead associated (FHA) protein